MPGAEVKGATGSASACVEYGPENTGRAEPVPPVLDQTAHAVPVPH
jgi:hypothetical protein